MLRANSHKHAASADSQAMRNNCCHINLLCEMNLQVCRWVPIWKGLLPGLHLHMFFSGGYLEQLWRASS